MFLAFVLIRRASGLAVVVFIGRGSDNGVIVLLEGLLEGRGLELIGVIRMPQFMRLGSSMVSMVHPPTSFDWHTASTST